VEYSLKLTRLPPRRPQRVFFMPSGVYKRKPVPQSVRDKISKSNKGKFFSAETRKKIGLKTSLSMKGLPEELGRRWKGDNVGYHGLHKWVEKHLGKASKCENLECVYPKRTKSKSWIKFPKRFEWANKDHTYKRNLKDWIQFCVSCHRKYDIENNNYKMGFLEYQQAKNL